MDNMTTNSSELATNRAELAPANPSKLLSYFLMNQVRRQLAEKNIELRCNHEVLTFSPAWRDGLMFQVETVEQYHQPHEQALIERELITREVNDFLLGVGL